MTDSIPWLRNQGFIDLKEERMGDLSQNFSKVEFACHDGCGFDDPDARLIKALQELREQVGSPLIVVSGCRCQHHNSGVGGANGSQHLLGKAADIRSDTLTPVELKTYAVKIPAFKNGGIGLYEGWLHVDVRHGMARWEG
jgi:uncharacterized protein YcbK (DUF882 family)